MLALAHPLSSLLCPCSGPGPAASSGLFLRPLPTSPLPVIPVKPSRLLQGHTHSHTQPMPQFQRWRRFDSIAVCRHPHWLLFHPPEAVSLTIL
ncbi:uncharacterized protein CCOS01_00545 [Colletotrichum costaricense]|uniref:Uncharacterized protein n=1 Tax=Colletotrichum costaricense TaxID=1209916 RepID=A0AAI9ZAX3_9PEZI|nr:uncharacterized protein CCOS01_00545 [Colletotrichum costaricense]KAK1539231.1 hypothetical protein CCOS01_00545 [Colletotrichum costaricense]